MLSTGMVLRRTHGLVILRLRSLAKKLQMNGASHQKIRKHKMESEIIQRSSFGNKKRTRLGSSCFRFGEGRPDVVARLCMVVDWCIDHPEYTAKIKVIPKKDYPVLMPCEF